MQMCPIGPHYGICKHTYEIKIEIPVINNSVNLYCFFETGFWNTAQAGVEVMNFLPQPT